MIDAIFRSLSVGAVRLITGAYARWEGCPPLAERPRVYFANHGSHLDFVAVWAALPKHERARTRPVAARDFWGASRLRRSVAENVFRALLIRRDHVSRTENPVLQMKAVLDTGESLILFPEGRRVTSGVVEPFKPGLFHLADRCPGVEFIPVFVHNLNRALPKGEILPIPVIATMAFGAPIQINAGEKKTDFLTRARDAVLALAPPA
jgi:1-acyl-sn-glycerol-3-phosphate acyltransferase